MIEYNKRKFDAYQIPSVDVAHFPKKQSWWSKLLAKLSRKKR
jgi:hypothetical protein